MIEVNNLTRSHLKEAFFLNIAKAVLRGEKKPNKELSIALVGPQRAAALNKKYRKKDKVANVLAFPAGNARIPSEVEGYLGEIVLCPQQIKKEAPQYGMIFEEALAFMLIHGLLHLLGYNHNRARDTKIIKRKEQEYLLRMKKFYSLLHT